MQSQLKYISIYVLFLALFGFLSKAEAKKSIENKTLLIHQKMTSIDRLHLAIGNGARNLANRLDRFFSDEQMEEELQTTRVRIKPTIQWSKEDKLEASVPFRIDLVLPRLENKWKIMVKSFSDKDDDQIPDETDFTDNNGDDQDEQTGTFLGLQYTPLAGIVKHVKTSVGPKFKGDSVSLFVSIRLRFQYVAGPWTTYLTQQLFYENDELGERTSLDLHRPIGNKKVFRSESTATHSESSKGVDLRQIFLIRYFFTENIAVGILGEIAAHTRPSSVVDAYVGSFEYRQKIWKEWLYFNLKPQARYPREENFKFTPFLSISVESIF